MKKRGISADEATLEDIDRGNDGATEVQFTAIGSSLRGGDPA